MSKKYHKPCGASVQNIFAHKSGETGAECGPSSFFFKQLLRVRQGCDRSLTFQHLSGMHHLLIEILSEILKTLTG